GGDVGVEIAVMAGLDGGLQPGAVVERKQHVVDRRAVGHDVTPRWLEPSSHETAEVSTAGKGQPWESGRRRRLNAARPCIWVVGLARMRGIFTIAAVEMATFSL